MKIGMSIPTVASPGDLAVELEALGFDYVATGEHVFFHGACQNAFITLAAAAAATTRIGLLSAATLVPVYPPALLVKLAVELHRVSGGRFTMGAALGGEFAAEFDAVGVPLAERGKRYDESLRLLRHLVGQIDEPFHGSFSNLAADVRLDPAPLEGGPRVWVAGRGPRAQQRTASYDAGWLPYMYSPERLASSVGAIREESEQTLGRPWTGEVGCVLPVFLGTSTDEAKKQAAARLSAQYGSDMSSVIDRYALAGTPSDIVARLHDYAEAGLEVAVLQPLHDPEALSDFARSWHEQVGDLIPMRGAKP